MSTTKPIKDKQTLEDFKNYYLTKKEYRNHLLIILGLNTALRISDILTLKWKNVISVNSHTFKKHIYLIEQKTNKESIIALNKSALEALELYLKSKNKNPCSINLEGYIFESRNHTGNPISRSQAFRIIKAAAQACGLEENISCHSLRKTFGYVAWKQGVSPVMLMNIYNHSSFQITKRYLSIEQDERDEVFNSINI